MKLMRFYRVCDLYKGRLFMGTAIWEKLFWMNIDFFSLWKGAAVNILEVAFTFCHWGN